MLKRLKVFPLRHNLFVCLEVEVSLKVFYTAFCQKIVHFSEKHGVKSRILILGENGNESKVYRLRLCYDV